MNIFKRKPKFEEDKPTSFGSYDVDLFIPPPRNAIGWCKANSLQCCDYGIKCKSCANFNKPIKISHYKPIK